MIATLFTAKAKLANGICLILTVSMSLLLYKLNLTYGLLISISLPALDTVAECSP